MRLKNLSAFVFLLLASPTFARNVNDPPSTTSPVTEIGELVPKTVTPTEQRTKDQTKTKSINDTWRKVTNDNVKEDAADPQPSIGNEKTDENVKFIPVEANLTNVSKNGAIENNFIKKNSSNPPSATIRSEFPATLVSGAKSTGSESIFVKIPIIDGDQRAQKTLPRNLNSYPENLDNVSQILLYPVNGTTVVYRETTFRPILPDGLVQKTEEANNGQDASYLPFATWSKVVPDVVVVDKLTDDRTSTTQQDLESRDEDVLEAANFGLEAMNDLYYIKEPKLFSMGLFLTDDNPGRYVAAFNDQTEEARQLARFGFAALEGARLFVNKHPHMSRTEAFVTDTRRTALHRQCPRRGIPPCPPASLRYRTTDGSCNNPNELWWGSAMSSMQRFLQPVYQDGLQTIRRATNGRLLPSPREISGLIHQDHDIPLASVTHMLMQWGQFIDHDLTATGQSRGFNGTVPQCCLNGGGSFQPSQFMHPECLPIPVPMTDKFYGPLGVRCLEFVRSGPAPREDCGFGPREQLSQVTSYLDGSTVYSSNVQISDSLRLFRNGLLQYGKIQSRKPLLPRQETDLCRRGSLATSCFRAGDGRLSEQPALISMHVIFLRQHNRIATQLAALNPHWSDEKLFQETRRIIGALIQHITYREFLPIVLGQDVLKAFDLEIKRKGYYDGYDPAVNANVANSFATAAYRFGHSLVQHSFVRYDRDHHPIFNNVTIHDEFNNPVNLHTAGSVDRLLLGLINQPSQKRDEFITSELTNHLFQTPGFHFGMDLASLNIQRGRDHGLPPYTDWREPCGLSAVRRWEDLDRVMSTSAARRFRALYTSVEDIDLFPAGLAEKPVPGGLVGPTFACIIAQQFSNLRKGDRFWFENPDRESSFTAAQLQQIKRVTLAQILCKTTENIETIQPFVFLTPDTFRNERIPCDSEIISTLNLDAWAERVPPEQRSKTRPRTKNRKGNRRKGQAPKGDTDSGDDRKRADGGEVRLGSEEKSFFPFFNTVKTGVNQQNKVVIRRPINTNDNLTILVQNNAVNSPVFVSDSVNGNNFQFTQSTNGVKPTYRPTQRPTSPRPIYYDDTQANPIFIPSPSPSPVRPKPKPKPKPKPPSYGNPQPYPGPYIPHGINDPSNPNPPNYGFVSRPTNNYPPSNTFFDHFAGATTQRPTLYTFYTTFKRPTVTQRPSGTYYGHVRPLNDHDQHQHYQQDHSYPSTASWPITKPSHEHHDHIYHGNPQPTWTQRPNYEHDWDDRPNVPSHSSSYPSSHGRPTNGYWTELHTSTKKYPATDSYYYDAEYQIQNAEANINPRPFKKQSVTIITDSTTDVHYPDNQRPYHLQKKNEVPKPLFGQRDQEDDVAEHKDTYEIDLDKVNDKRTKPGQFYYEKNVLHRYPDDGNFTADESHGHGETDESSYEGDTSFKYGAQNSQDDREHNVPVDKIVVDTKYQIERLYPDRAGGPPYIKDTDTKAQVSHDENKFTTTATVVLDDKKDDPVEEEEDEDDDYDDVYEEDEEQDDEFIGAYSETSEHTVAPDTTISPIDWINIGENSSLILHPEMPNLATDEFVSTKEIPRPLKQRKTGS